MTIRKLERSEYYPGMSDDNIGALQRYLDSGIMPGGFLTAVLENNLSESFGRADSFNTANMKDICGYIYNHFPSIAWGSRERVAAFVNQVRSKTESAA